MTAVRTMILVLVVSVFLFAPIAEGKQDQHTPKEFGFYVKTGKGLQRVMPNILFDQEGVIYIESNEPRRFDLNDVQHFLVYGEHDLSYLTLNPLLFFHQSPLGKIRFVLGKDLPIEVKKMGQSLYSVKPQGLFGRGYYCFWVEDLIWDFIVE
jgi:hypothetical protein